MTLKEAVRKYGEKNIKNSLEGKPWEKDQGEAILKTDLFPPLKNIRYVGGIR